MNFSLNKFVCENLYYSVLNHFIRKEEFYMEF
jgi:hypothetical protein